MVALAPPVVVIVGGLGTDVTAVIFAVDLLVICMVNVKLQFLGTEVGAGVKTTTSDLSVHGVGAVSVAVARLVKGGPVVVVV